MAEAKNFIKKENWISSFTLVGKPKINDYTFKIDEHSKNSSWVYNAMSLMVYCGEKHGNIACEMMGGYSPERGDNKLYVHGKDEKGKDDFKKQITVDWEDRLDYDVLDSVGDMSFIKIGIKKNEKGKTITKRFLSEYDAINYLYENMTEGMVIRVQGNLKYSIYNENVQVRKTIKSIFLSNVEDESGYYARFTQSLLLDKDSASLKDVDKATGIMYVDARVLDYAKEINGVEIGGQYPFAKQFEYVFDLSNPNLCKKRYDVMFKVKKGITQETFEGIFIEGGATTNATWDDVPDDVKQLFEAGVYTEEEALQKCTANGSRERRMVLIRTQIKKASEDNPAELQKFEEMYTEEDLDMSWVYDGDEYQDDEEDEDETPFEETESDEDGSSGDGNDLDWLSDLD